MNAPRAVPRLGIYAELRQRLKQKDVRVMKRFGRRAQRRAPKARASCD